MRHEADTIDTPRLFLETAPDPVVVADAESGEIFDVNETAVEFFGRERSELIGSSVSTLHPRRIRDQLESLFFSYTELALNETVTNDRLPDGRDITVRTAGGEEVPVEISARAAEVDGTQILTGIFRDVTQRRERQAEVERYRPIVENVHSGILITDPEGVIEYVNPAFTVITGYDFDRVCGATPDIVEAHPDRTAPTVRELLADGASWEGESRNRRKDGSTYRARQTTFPIRDYEGTVQKYVSVQVDLTERVERETRLRSFEKAVEHAGHSIYWTDTDGTIKYVNPAFEAITGYDAEEVVGETPRILKSGAMPDSYYEEFWATLEAGETFQGEVINEDKDGERFVIDQTVTPITDEDGEPERYVAVNRDVTAQKRREQRLEAEKDHNELLRQRLSVLDRVFRHDVRTATNVIQGNASRVRESIDDCQEPLDTVLDTAAQLGSISEQTGQIRRLLTERPDPQPIAVEAILDPVLEDLTERFPDAAITNQVTDPPPIDGSPDLEIALENAIENAVVHNDAGTPTVDVHADWTETSVTVRIEDDGPGIPDRELEPLRQGIETPLEHTSGLGLWLIYWLVREHGGEVAVTDRDPQGTSLSITLPRADGRSERRGTEDGT